MDSPLLRRALAGALVILGVLLLLLLLWPQARSERPGPPAASPPLAALPEAEGGGEVGRVELVRGVAIEDLPDPTENCVTLVEWNNRNVPPWVIEDNMDAQAMRFDERDMACMRAGRLPDQVMDRAVQHLLRPQPRPR